MYLFGVSPQGTQEEIIYKFLVILGKAEYNLSTSRLKQRLVNYNSGSWSSFPPAPQKIITNKKVLLRDRKRCTTHCIASNLALLSGWGKPYPGRARGYPSPLSPGRTSDRTVVPPPTVPCTGPVTGPWSPPHKGPWSRDQGRDLGSETVEYSPVSRQHLWKHYLLTSFGCGW